MRCSSGKLAQQPFEVVRGPSVECSTSSRSASATTVAAPLPIRQCATSRSALISQSPESSPGETVENVVAAELPCAWPRARPARRAADPNAQQAGVHEHGRRPQRIAERPLARPFEHRIGEQQDAAAAPHPIDPARRDPRLAARAGGPSAASRPLLSSARVRDADRHDAIARLQRLQRRRAAALEREFLGENERQAGQQEQASASAPARARLMDRESADGRRQQ